MLEHTIECQRYSTHAPCVLDQLLVKVGALQLIDKHCVVQNQTALERNKNANAPNHTGPVHNSTSPHNSTNVLLITFYRGGSSFLGELFNQNLDAFYWFEPLRTTYVASQRRLRMFGDAGTHTYLEGQAPRQVPTSYTKEQVKIIESIFRCDLNTLDHKAMLVHEFALRSRSTGKIFKIPQCKGAKQRANSACVAHLRQECGKYRLRVIKTIRLSLYMLEEFLEVNPDTKVIYYVRDPRGIESSRAAIHGSGSHAQLDINLLCFRIEEDLSYLQRFQKKFPNRIIMLRYEDLAGEPLKEARAVYKFLGQTLPVYLESWLAIHTNQTSKDQYGTSRISKTIANQWTTRFKHNLKEYTTSKCKTVLQKLGYSLGLT